MHFFVNSRNGFTLNISFPPSFADIWEVIRVSLPRTIGLSANQIALFALVALQQGLSMDLLVLILRSIFNLPLVVIGVSYATAAFPALSKHFAEDEMKNFLKILAATQHIVFWSLPVLVLMIVLRAQIVRTILGSGSFDWTATKLTAAGLAIFTVSIVAQSVGLLFVRGFYATGNNGIPLFVNVISAIVIILGGYGFLALYAHAPTFQYFIESLFRVEDIRGTSVLMLPLAYSVGMLVNSVLLIYLFRRRFGKFLSPLKDALMHGTFAALLAGLVAYEFLEIFDSTSTSIHLWEFSCRTCSRVAGLPWWLILELMGNEEIRDVRTALHHQVLEVSSGYSRQRGDLRVEYRMWILE